MSLHDYEQDIRHRTEHLSQSSGICFAVETITRHYSLLQRDGIVPHAHAFSAELDEAIAGLRPPFAIPSIRHVCQNAEETALIHEGVPVAVIELAISLQHFLDYIAECSPDCLERISYRCLSYVDSLHDINDNTWFSHPEIQNEYAEQLATIARCAEGTPFTRDAQQSHAPEPPIASLGGMSTLPANIRVASWLGVECIRHYMITNAIDDPRLNAFCQHISKLVEAIDLPGWDAAANQLEITGPGDPLPEPLNTSELFELVESVREISCSQMYGAFRPAEVVHFLNRSISVSGLDVSKYDLAALRKLEAADGWGKPIRREQLERLRNAT